MLARHILAWLCCAAVVACSSHERDFVETPANYPSNLSNPNVSVRIAGLSNCSDRDSDPLRLNTAEPVTVIVHGCFSSAGRFRSIAEVFEFHGQQTICFSYDDRERLTTVASQLKTALAELSQLFENPEITLIGHSQGGLISRRALIANQADSLEKQDIDIQLTTISSPFGGIEAASHCGSTTAAWLSLGMVKLMCHAITGSKYQDIPPNSPFIEQPGELISSVKSHLKIVTDETDSCRRLNDRGGCAEDDFVFSVEEQQQTIVDAQPATRPLNVKAGHVEIVGDGSQVPKKLIAILQQRGVMRDTPPAAAADLEKLLAGLYTHSPAPGE